MYVSVDSFDLIKTTPLSFWEDWFVCLVASELCHQRLRLQTEATPATVSRPEPDSSQACRASHFTLVVLGPKKVTFERLFLARFSAKRYTCELQNRNMIKHKQLTGRPKKTLFLNQCSHPTTNPPPDTFRIFLSLFWSAGFRTLEPKPNRLEQKVLKPTVSRELSAIIASRNDQI